MSAGQAFYFERTDERSIHDDSLGATIDFGMREWTRPVSFAAILFPRRCD